MLGGAALILWGVTLGAVSSPAYAGQSERIPETFELRVGFLRPDVGVFGTHKEKGGIDLNGEVLFNSPRVLSWIGAPRPHVGITGNTAGNTGYVYIGMTWHFELWRALFLEPSVGGAAHNGKYNHATNDRKSLGCSLQFRESLSLGYHLTKRVNASLYLDHISNAGICSGNEGMESAGLRMGYSF
jgi:hypothetical protein